MIKLPRHLSPWAAQLSLFPEDMALVLGQMVCQIANLIGGWRQRHAEAGTPDGYDGAVMRGTYDRLLTSEWLLLDEAPEEFLRRAVSGEHAFLRRAWREHAAAKRCVALFDSGPEQLGAPRIAQLAIMIILAQRAENHGASFEWGVLQDLGATLRKSVDAAQIRILMQSRCAQRVSGDDVERWMTAGSSSGVASELWLVGASRLHREAQRHGASSLILAEVLEPGVPQRLRVTATTPDTNQVREATLAAPTGATAAQLLRGPSGSRPGTRQKTPAKMSVKSNIVFAQSGHGLWARCVDGGLAAFLIPGSPPEATSPPRVFTPPQGEAVVAVAPKKWSGGRTIVALEGPDGLEICTLTKRSGAIQQTLASVAYPEGARPAWSNTELLLPLSVFDRHHCCFCDEQNRVEISNGSCALTTDRVFAASRAAPEGHLSVESFLRSFVVRHTTLDSDNKMRETPVDLKLPHLSPLTRFFFGNGPRDTLAAYCADVSACLVHWSGAFTKFEIPSGYSVVGMLTYGAPPVAAVVIIDDARSRIELLHAEKRVPVLTSAVPIAYAAASDVAPAIAYLTEDGELGVYRCYADGAIWRVARWEAP